MVLHPWPSCRRVARGVEEAAEWLSTGQVVCVSARFLVFAGSSVLLFVTIVKVDYN